MIKQCEICKKKSVFTIGELRFSNPGYSKKSKLIECAFCNFARVYPKPNEKKIASVYKGNYHYRKFSILDIIYQFFLDQELAKDIDFIKEHKTKGSVLDIGAGRGDMLVKLCKDFEKWAYDPFISKRDQALLRKKIGDHVNDFKTLSKYPNDTFDIVIIRNIIEHTNEFDDLLKNINKILKKNGIVFIRTPNTDSVDYKLLKNKWWVTNMDGHIVFFSKDSMQQTLKKHEFKNAIIKPEKGSSLLSLFRSMDASIPKWLSIPVSIIYSLISPMLGEGGDIMVIAKK